MSELPPVRIFAEEALVLFDRAIEREDIERAMQWAALVLSVNDPEDADA